ncbi:MAG: glycosyltransferase [Ardenticatenaceae bacterium]|nr:glycosyltransferase [Ardenticatenaceae bacterium]MCB9443920.1 glycosyltransferase [Ardenticatenaceae bacterium]
MAQKIAYIMSRFPHLPETFILREMDELVRQGLNIALYPLIRQQQETVHEEAMLWLPRARPLPLFSWQTLTANLRALFKQPGIYLNLWRHTLLESWRDPYMLVRLLILLPKSVYAAQAMQKESIEHIHAHYATFPAFAAWIIHQLNGISYSVTVHAHDIFVRRTMLKRKLGEASFIAAISEYNKQYLKDIVGDKIARKVHIIHCGIEPRTYEPSLLDRKPGYPLEIIHIGSLQPYKGQRFLIEACRQLLERGIPFRCRIIGGGEEHANLTRMIEAMGLESVVELMGSKTQQEIAHLLPTAHCYVQPSVITPSGKMEGIPVALMEAMASRLPVIATSISGIPELVRHGETGYLVPPADALALADVLAAVYENPEKAASLAENGRSQVLQAFDLQTNVTQLANLFTAVHNLNEKQTVFTEPQTGLRQTTI